MWFFNRSKRTPTDKALAKTLEANGGLVWLDAMNPDAGAIVTREVAMEIPVVFACINARMEDIGKIPLRVYQDQGGGVKVPAPWTKEYQFVKYGPNLYMTAQAWQEQIVGQCSTDGDHYARIARVGAYVDELYPVEDPTEVETKIVAGSPVHTWNGQAYSSADMFHVAGPSLDGYSGRAMTHTHRQTFSLARALFKYGARYFATGGTIRGILVLPAGTNPKDIPAAKQLFRDTYGGDNLHEIAVYGPGTDFKPISVDPDKGQVLQTRQQVASEICGIMNMPEWRIFQKQAPNLEARRGYYTDSLGPWMTRISSAITKYLLPAGFFCEHVTAAFLQADILARMQSYAAAITSRIMNPNEVRAIENMPPYAGGEEFYNPNVMDAATNAAVRGTGKP